MPLAPIPSRAPPAYRAAHRIADAAAPHRAREIEDALGELQRRFPLSRFRQLLEARYPGLAYDQIDWAEVFNPMFGFTLAGLERIIRDSVGAHAKLLPDSIVKAAPQALADAGFSFQITNEEALRWARMYAGITISGISEETKAAIRAIIIRLFRQEGMTPAKAAAQIRRLIGLTARQAMAVDNYRVGLENRRELAQMGRQQATTLNPWQQAYWQGQVVRTQEQIDQMVDRYARRLLRQRAETIARTETMAASNAGAHIAHQQAAAAGLIDPERTKRMWMTTPEDGRLCDICRPMNGIFVNLDQPFVQPETYQQWMNPPAHPNCRCTTELIWVDENGQPIQARPTR